MATEMLKLRTLSIPTQRFTASDDIRRMLLSHNVLHETEDNKLTFGHQTLLDVLVISRAIRHGLTLNNFIKDLLQYLLSAHLFVALLHSLSMKEDKSLENSYERCLPELMLFIYVA